ncbi:MAG TPA: hypothetical protein VJY43_01115 [Methanocorpusculum sp.]|nr:hypothetical protein [Methanocorpusculum sp.]
MMVSIEVCMPAGFLIADGPEFNQECVQLRSRFNGKTNKGVAV